MAEKIKVIVRDKNTLILDQDAKKGDIIDLTDLQKVDDTLLLKLIEENKDAVYNKKLNDIKNDLILKYEEKLKSEVVVSNTNIEKEKDKIINNLKEKIYKLETENKNINENLNNKLSTKEIELNKQFIQEKNKIELENKKTIDSYLEKIEKLNNEKTNLVEQHAKEVNVLNKQISDVKAQMTEKYDLLNNQYNLLKNEKSILVTKNVGEDLEQYCNNEMEDRMQNGFLNCIWYKDNDVIKDEGEDKGTKADFIFKVYKDENHNEKDLLTSVCLEMKNDTINSTNKHKNSDFYKTLDKNRVKKNCEYALLVSNLELNQDNDLPIRKVSEYKNMYVVRPGYMVTFLNLITSLSNKFKDLILKDYEYSIEIQKQSDFKLEYEKLKNTYLDKPLEGLKSKIENIQDQSNKIKNCASAIDKELDSIIHNYIEGIIDKLDKFDVKMITNYKKLNK